MNNSSGFYSFSNNEIIFIQGDILAPGIEILRENKDNYQYPILGWYWFDSSDTATAFFNSSSEN